MSIFFGMSSSEAGQPRNELIDDQKITVKTQNVEIQAVLKYHFNYESVNNQKVRPPNTNNKIGNAIFISLKSLNHTHLL